MLLFEFSGVICRVWWEDEEAFLWSEGGWDSIKYPASSCLCPIISVVVEGCLYMEGLIKVGSLRTGEQ